MPTRHSRAGGNPEGKGGENHGNLSAIMAIMVQNLPPSHSVRGLGGCPHVIPAHARIQRERDGKIMAIITPSRQSWFKTSPLRIHTMSFRAQRGISNVILAKARIQRERDGKIMAIIPTSWQSWFKTSTLAFTPCHSEHSEESPPFAPRKGARGMPGSQERSQGIHIP